MIRSHTLRSIGASVLVLSLGTTIWTVQKAHRSLKEMHDTQWHFSVEHTLRQVEEQSQPQLHERKQTTVQGSAGDDGIHAGILSHKPPEFFRSIQKAVDSDDLGERCRRYGFGMRPKANSSDPDFTHRRIFYGSLIADEPWELLEIIAAETYGIFEAMVFIESNRTQTAEPRPFRRNLKHLEKIKNMFGISARQIELRRFVNEDTTLEYIAREHRQRQEILKGWKGLGMTGTDIGLIADIDESFTRDFLLAIKHCPYVEALDYDSHSCFNPLVKVAGYTRMFEASPECITEGRTWYHPDMIVGACVELIGNETLNPPAPRTQDFLRAPGHAHSCGTKDSIRYRESFGNISGNKFPLWSAADFRRQCGGHNYKLDQTNHAKYSAFHLHNFYNDFGMAVRQKYSTYGHPVRGAFRKRLESIGDDLKMTVRCVQNWTDAPTSKSSTYMTETQQWQREIGGFEAAMPPLPIYFLDHDYRQRKHLALQNDVARDERQRQRRMRLKPGEKEIEQLKEEAQELKRQAWQKEALAQGLLAKHT